MDEPVTAEWVEKKNREVKIHKLATLLSKAWVGLPADAYRATAEYLFDNGVEVDVVHCGECQYLNKKVDCGGFCRCGEVNGGCPTMRVNWGYCDYGERRKEPNERTQGMP